MLHSHCLTNSQCIFLDYFAMFTVWVTNQASMHYIFQAKQSPDCHHCKPVNGNKIWRFLWTLKTENFLAWLFWSQRLTGSWVFFNLKFSIHHINKNKRLKTMQEKMIAVTASDFMFLLYQKIGEMSGVGFEPTPTRVDCDLNAAP